MPLAVRLLPVLLGSATRVSVRCQLPDEGEPDNRRKLEEDNRIEGVGAKRQLIEELSDAGYRCHQNRRRHQQRVHDWTPHGVPWSTQRPGL